MPGFPNLTIRTPPSINPALLAAQRQLGAVTTKIDGVLEGGGALGVAYCGALRLLQDQGIWFARVAGNSAGAITAGMIAAGFDATEMQWLMSFSTPGPKPLSLTALETPQKRFSPIAFIKFLDLPTIGTISQRSKRKTALWNALDLSLADMISRIQVPIPTQRNAVTQAQADILAIPVIGTAIAAVPAPVGTDLLHNVLNTAFAFLPNTQPTVGDLLPILKLITSASAGLRAQLADTLWDAIVKRNPLLAIETNLEQEGSIFEGGFALTTIRQMLELKLGKSPVLFSDLKIPLMVIAANLTTQKMEVYSSTMTPNMEVAEAVRRSMSVPFVFQPRNATAPPPVQLNVPLPHLGGRPIVGSGTTILMPAGGLGPQLPGGSAAGMIVDGGLCSNFPVWAFAPSSAGYWPPASVDNARPVIGLSLDETLPEKSSWNVDKPRFVVPAGQTRVPDTDVIVPMLADKIEEWIPINLQVPASDVGPILDEVSARLGTSTWQVELAGSIGMNSESSTRAVIVSALMQGRAYFDVPIPLRGYHWLDFRVNEDMGALLAMWDRSWHAALDSLSVAPPTMTGGAALVTASGLTSPFGP